MYIKHSNVYFDFYNIQCTFKSLHVISQTFINKNEIKKEHIYYIDIAYQI